MNSIDFDVKIINHLGFVAELCKIIRIADFIDSKIFQTFNNVRKVSVGQAVVAMILIGLGLTQRRLYIASDFNDDVLGRALDALYNANPSNLFSLCSANICKTLGIRTKYAHLDSTSIHVMVNTITIMNQKNLLLH